MPLSCDHWAYTAPCKPVRTDLALASSSGCRHTLQGACCSAPATKAEGPAPYRPPYQHGAGSPPTHVDGYKPAAKPAGGAVQGIPAGGYPGVMGPQPYMMGPAHSAPSAYYGHPPPPAGYPPPMGSASSAPMHGGYYGPPPPAYYGAPPPGGPADALRTAERFARCCLGRCGCSPASRARVSASTTHGPCMHNLACILRTCRPIHAVPAGRAVRPPRRHRRGRCCGNGRWRRLPGRPPHRGCYDARLWGLW